jgi:hypothetical protein
MENWGKSVDGYTGGGNFDDNPNLENFTLKKYNQMKEQGIESLHSPYPEL